MFQFKDHFKPESDISHISSSVPVYAICKLDSHAVFVFIQIIYKNGKEIAGRTEP